MKVALFTLSIFAGSCAQETINMRSSSVSAVSQSSSENLKKEPQKLNPQVQMTLADEKYSMNQMTSIESKIVLKPSDFKEEVKLSFSELPSSFNGEFISNGKETSELSILLDKETEVEIRISHMGTQKDMSLDLDQANSNIPFSVTMESNSLSSKTDAIIDLSSVAILKVKDPAMNGGTFTGFKKITLPMGTGLCLLNENKDGMVFHGNPHQSNDGMPLGACFDKYAGDSKSMSEIDKIEPCKTAGTDTIYDHNAGAIDEQPIEVICKG